MVHLSMRASSLARPGINPPRPSMRPLILTTFTDASPLPYPSLLFRLSSLRLLLFPSGAPPPCSNLESMLSLPQEVMSLVRLQSLSLASTTIPPIRMPSIPSVIGQLTSLTSLQISNAVAGGSFPASLSRLKQLKSLSLGGTTLSATIPHFFSCLTSLTRL
ncbi:unnamed protein product, partial [Closterium sp. Naga37s-1]